MVNWNRIFRGAKHIVSSASTIEAAIAKAVKSFELLGCPIGFLKKASDCTSSADSRSYFRTSRRSDSVRAFLRRLLLVDMARHRRFKSSAQFWVAPGSAFGGRQNYGPSNKPVRADK